MGSSVGPHTHESKSFFVEKCQRESECQILFLPLLFSHSWPLAALAIQEAPPEISAHPNHRPSRSSTQLSTWASGMSSAGSQPSSSSTHGVSEQLMDRAPTLTSLVLVTTSRTVCQC